MSRNKGFSRLTKFFQPPKLVDGICEVSLRLQKFWWRQKIVRTRNSFALTDFLANQTQFRVLTIGDAWPFCWTRRCRVTGDRWEFVREIKYLDCSQSPIFPWDRRDIARLTGCHLGTTSSVNDVITVPQFFSPPPPHLRAIIPDARPLGPCYNQDGHH